MDPYAETVTVLLLRDGDYDGGGIGAEVGYNEVNTYQKDEILISRTLEGFAVNLDDIFP